MIRLVRWTSVSLLSCACDKNPLVILCVDPDLVVSQACPFEYGTIEANLASHCRSGSSWNYTFRYDDSQLVEGAVLTHDDIMGAFCYDCMAQWAEEQVGDEMSLEETEEGFDLITPHGCVYPIAAGEGGLSLDFLFGDGDDGSLIVLNGQDVTLPADPLGRNWYFEDLTIDEGGILTPIGETFDGDYAFYQIFVSGTLTINGTLHADGGNGDNGVGATPGANGAPRVGNYGPGGGSVCGGNGGRGTSGIGASAVGQSIANTTNCRSVFGYMGGGVGGAGGAGGNGSAGGSVTDTYFFRLRSIFFLLTSYSSHHGEIIAPIFGGAAGAGGGGGGRTGTAEGGAGGGGGGGGGTIWIAARNIVIGPTGLISANGGNGGNGANGTAGGGGDTAGGGGAGGAAGGGLIYLMFETLTNNGSMTVDAGSPGTGGSGVGGGADGGNGVVADAGQIYLLNMRTGLFE